MGLSLNSLIVPVLGFNFLDPSNWLTILMAAFGLGMVIFVHELGHFAVAKWCGVKCEKFYLGFDIYGLKLCSFRRGETEYGIGILPLGGYVKMLGQDDNPAHAKVEMERSRLESIPGGAPAPEPVEGESGMYDPRSYMAQSVPKRMAIISAGVIMNIIFAFVVSVIAYGMGVRYMPCTVSRVVPGGVAWTNDVRVGDEVVRIDDIIKPRFDKDLMSQTALADLQSGLELEIQRPGQDKTLVKQLTPTKAAGDMRPTIGLFMPLTAKLGVSDEFQADTSAAKAQPPLKNNDLVVAVNDKPIKGFAELDAAFVAQADQPIKLTVLRKAEDAPADAEGEQIETTIAPQPRKVLGIVTEFGPIMGVQKDSPAAAAGVRVGDRLLKIDGVDAGDPITLGERLQKRAGETVRLTLSRGTPAEPVEVSATLRPVAWSEKPISPKSLESAPALGIAYEVRPYIAAVEPNGPAAKAGLTAGKQIKAARFVYPKDQAQRVKDMGLPLKVDFVDDDNEKERADWPNFCEQLQSTIDGTQVQLVLGDDKEVLLTPSFSSEFFLPERGLHCQFAFETRKAESFSEALSLGLRETKEDVLMVYRFLQKLSTNQISPQMLRGPATIAYVAGGAASAGLPQLLIFLAMLSANLAVINFLPIPILDGGHMVFLALEGIRGKPVSEKVVVAFHYVGFCFIISLMVFVISMDVKDFAGW